jgi:hypothetical protein
MSTYQHDGWINAEGDIVHDDDDRDPEVEWQETFEWMDVGAQVFEGPDSLAAAQAQAEKWEAMEVEKSFHRDKWELVET